MATVKNTTDKKIVVRTGTSIADYRFYAIQPHKSRIVNKEVAKAIADKVKKSGIVGISVSKHLPKPLLKPKKEAEGENASVEIN